MDANNNKVTSDDNVDDSVWPAVFIRQQQIVEIHVVAVLRKICEMLYIMYQDQTGKGIQRYGKVLVKQTQQRHETVLQDTSRGDGRNTTKQHNTQETHTLKLITTRSKKIVQEISGSMNNFKHNIG